jgi:hypothetical protein
VRCFRLLAPALFAVTARKADHRKPEMTSPYLDRPLMPLAATLPRMLEKIEAELAAAGPGQEWRLRRRAELMRDLLTASPPALSRST